MVKEIITIHVGSFGAGVGKSFWEQQCIENGIGLDGKFNKKNLVNDGKETGTYFIETKKGKFTPRAIFLDNDNTSIEELKSLEFKDLFGAENLFYGNFDVNHYGYACDDEVNGYITNSSEKLRKEVEKCNSLEGIVVMNSVSSGFGSLIGGGIMNNCATNYSNAVTYGVNLYLDNNFKTSIQIYDTVLGFQK